METTYEQKQEGQRMAYLYAKDIHAFGFREEAMVVAAYMAGWCTALERGGVKLLDSSKT